MVMLKLGHEELEIRVECGGAKLQEYGRTVQGDQQECWIASNENTEFRIMCNRIPSAEKRLLEGRLEVFIDGVKTNKHALHPKPGLITIRGARVSPKERRDFVFGKLHLQEDGGILEGDALAMLGTIRAVLRQVKNRRLVKKSHSSRTRSLVLPGDQSINERTKKAAAHATRLGRARTSKLSRSIAQEVPGSPAPSVVFHYAPIDFLQAREIVPRNTSLVLAVSSNSGSRALLSPASSVKPSDGHSLQFSKDIKPKVEESKAKMQAQIYGHVIELSTDDDEAAASKPKVKLEKVARPKVNDKKSYDGEVIVLSD